MKTLAELIISGQIKPMNEWSETELREEAKKLGNQYNKAMARLDKFGSLKCEAQANSYLKKYTEVLSIMYNNGFNLTKKERQIVSLIEKRI